MENSSTQALSGRLAAQIMEHARRQGLKPGSHLPEQGLADLFRVSRSPIRIALQLLATMEIVETRPNRGYFLKKAAEDFERMPTLFSMKEDEDPLYYQIAEDLLAGRLEIRVTENALMRQYGVPRSRLNRLLPQIEKEGWVEKLPGHGWEFQPALTSAATYEQSYRFRRLIEPAALEEPGYTVDPEAFSEIRYEQESMLSGGIFKFSSAEIFQISAHYHETIVSGSGNSFLIESIRRVNRLRRLFEYRINTDRNRNRLLLACKDHLKLLDIIESGDLPKAAKFLRAHLADATDAKVGMARSATN